MLGKRALWRAVVTQSEVDARMADIRSNFTYRFNQLDRIQITFVEGAKTFMFPSEAVHPQLYGEATSYAGCLRIKAKMQETESGRRVLKERPRIRSPFISKEKLASYPPETLGGEYYKFLSSYGFEYDHRPLVSHMPDEELAYIYQRYKEIHDFSHVCLKQGVTMYDEMAVKFFEYQQTTLAIAATSVVFSPFVTIFAVNWKMAAQMVFEDGPKLIRAAAKAKDFMSIMWEDHFDEDFVRCIQETFRMWVFNAEDEDEEILGL